MRKEEINFDMLDHEIKLYEMWSKDSRIEDKISKIHKQMVKWLKDYRRIKQMGMTLYDLSQLINDSTYVVIFAACTGEPIAEYDGKDSIPDYYMDDNVTDIFVDNGKLCIEIDIEPDTDYEE